MMDDDMEAQALACATSVRDGRDSTPHGYKYSRVARSADMRTSCRQPKSSVFLPSLFLSDKRLNGKAVKVRGLRLGPKDF
jgi:hypothetical protein